MRERERERERVSKIAHLMDLVKPVSSVAGVELVARNQTVGGVRREVTVADADPESSRHSVRML